MCLHTQNVYRRQNFHFLYETSAAIAGLDDTLTYKWKYSFRVFDPTSCFYKYTRHIIVIILWQFAPMYALHLSHFQSTFETQIRFGRLRILILISLSLESGKECVSSIVIWKCLIRCIMHVIIVMKAYLSCWPWKIIKLSQERRKKITTLCYNEVQSFIILTKGFLALIYLENSISFHDSEYS